MRHDLRAERDASGQTCVRLPAEWLWEFVEYLSILRLNTHYHYGTTHFTVVFPNLDVPAVQRVLDDWEKSVAFEPASTRLA